MTHKETIDDFAEHLKKNPSHVDVALDLLSIVQCYRKHTEGVVDNSDLRINCKVCDSCPHCAPKNWEE